MGRKRKSPQIVLLRVINEGEKLTEEQKAWLLNNRKGKQDVTSIRRKKTSLCNYSKGKD